MNNNNNFFIWNSENKLTPDDVLEFFNNYLNIKLPVLKMYHSYYEIENDKISRYWRNRERRNKTPNNFVPTSYYKTVVDSMSGYMFNNVQYESENENYSELINDLLTNNNVDVKDMTTGINALMYNKGVELVYTTGDESSTDIKYTSLDPRNIILIYDNKIEPDLFCAIRIINVNSEDIDYKLDVIYSDEWQYYQIKNDVIKQYEQPRALFFNECPVCVYRANIASNKSPFHQILKYIDALDYLITGNSNEIEKLVDALLVLGTTLSDEQLFQMDEWKVLEEIKSEDRAEYLTKNMSPEFREYASKLLIQEIHKHSHVIDWYSPDSGLSGAVSAKALKTRLFDMDMYANRIEKIYKEGAEKRIRLINQIMNIKSIETDSIKIIYNKSLPSDLEDKAGALNLITFMSDKTKQELCGLDPVIEAERLDEQRGSFEEEPAEREIKTEIED